MGGGRGGGGSEIKPMEKEDMFNNMLKNQGAIFLGFSKVY